MHQADYESVVQDMRLKVRHIGSAAGQQEGWKANGGVMCFSGILVAVAAG